MSKVLNDKVLIEKFLDRGVEAVYPSKDLLRELLISGKRIKVYQGFDPTGKYLHVGHAMGIRALRILQMLGHEVIFLVGDFTAKVGDPDKDNARKMLTDEEIEANMQGWKQQAAKLIDFDGDNPVQFRHNHEWLSKLNLADLIKLMSKATVQQMVERDMFSRRLKENDPIGLQEFIYPLMQGYDSVAMGVDLEIGGTDQTFNMLMGRQLVKDYLNKEKFVRTNIMMDAPDGRTMSKTKGNGINLGDTPENMYGKAMSYSDELIVKGLTLLTEVALDEIAALKKSLDAGENPMSIKKRFAFEVVATIMGTEAANLAQNHFERTVQNKEIGGSDAIGITNPGNGVLSSILKTIISDESLSQIRRTIEQGGVELNYTKKTDPLEEIMLKEGDILKYGKRRFYRIK